jgi:hypothetical protein
MKQETTHEETIGNYIIKVYQDESPYSPREDDNLGTMICFHKRYNLGDKHNFNFNDYSSWNEQRKEFQKQKPCVILPLYLYDHSGITMNTTGFSCGWDSGQVGWIFVTKEQVRKEYDVKYITQKIREKVKKVLEAEVKVYDQYLTGDVYGYQVCEVDEDGNEGEEVSSCWGYYGEEECINDAKRIVEYYSKKEKEVV